MKLSICMMVKNESKYLEQCLRSLQPLRDGIESELIIVDTGSEDDTVEIARKYTEKVYFHKWNNDFSAMRNKTISYAKGEWSLIIDADEVLQEIQPIIDFLRLSKNSKVGAGAITGKSITDENQLNEFSTIITPRLFKNDGYFHYEGVVHNQPMFKGLLIEISASLLHYGYISTDQELMERKFARTSALLKSELEKDPESIYYWFQLSVTYGMHNEFKEAMEYIEKAYELFRKQGKPVENMYVYAHLAHMHQLTRNYKKAEEICFESLQVKDGYLDIYYYLAESQAILNKYQASIDNYIKYLELLEQRENVVEKDTAVIEYTLGYKEMVYFNLSNIYKKVDNYDKALEYAKKVERKDYIQDNLNNSIDLFIQLGQYRELRNYYNNNIKKDDYRLFYEKMEEIKKRFSSEIQLAVAEVFYDVDNYYGLLSHMILDEKNGSFSDETIKKIKQLEFSEIPTCCSEILYFLVKKQYPLEEILTNFKEIWTSTLFDDLAKGYDDLSVLLFKYLQQYDPKSLISEYKLSKALCRQVLLLNKLDVDDYQEIFDRYISDGISYMKLLYNSCVVENGLVYEVKNDEEVFLLYMYQAQTNENIDQVAYVQYLGKALQAFPAMKIGIENLLRQFKGKKMLQNKKDLVQYQQQVKEEINQFIENEKPIEAGLLIAKYEQLIINDVEIYSMKAIVAMMEQRADDAEKILYDGLFTDATNFDLWYNLAHLYEICEKSAQAYSIYSKLIEKNWKPEHRPLLENSLERVTSTLDANTNVPKSLQEIKILQGTMEIANQMYTMNEALQKKGYNARSINYYPSYLGYQNDLTISFDGCKTDEEAVEKINVFAKNAIKEYDLFHFHFGTSLTLSNMDLPLLKMLGKKVIMNYWGSEVRRYSIAKQYNPSVKVKNYDEEQIIATLKTVAKSVDHCIVADWELYLYVSDFFPNVHFLPIAVDVTKYKPIKKKHGNKRPLIVHAPTHQEVKGTKYIIQAVKELKEKYDFDFQLVEGLHHEEAKKIYQQADIIIDQLLIGSYGVFAIESMAMEKTVISWISDYMKEKYPEDLPIVKANSETIKSVLEDLLNNMDKLPDINRKSRCYVEKYHSAEKVAEKLATIYEKILR